MKEHHYAIGPIWGRGKSITAAKDDAANQASAALCGSFDAFYARHQKFSLIVWRYPQTGWTYRIEQDNLDSDSISNLTMCCMSGDSREQCIASALMHMAQLAWSGDESETSPLLTGLPGKQADYTSWVRWQKGYRIAKLTGLSDNDAHQRAMEFYQGSLSNCTCCDPALANRMDRIIADRDAATKAEAIVARATA
jgi:hypothetical protein